MASHITKNGIAGRNAKTFLDDRSGNIAILFAMFLVPFILLMGLAIDGLRTLNAAETTADALDAAALAAARAMTEGGLNDAEVTEVANNYFNANVHGKGKIGYSTYAELEVTTDRARNEVTVAVKADVATTFARIAKIDKFIIRRESTVATGLNDIELGLMLDVTGSMNRNGKLRALKNATKDLIETIVPDGHGSDRVRIALAPYSEQVNTGRYADDVSDARNRSGCVVERRGADMNRDTAPGRNNKFHVVTRDEEQRYDRGFCPDAEILPLTSDKRQLARTVDSYRATGWTAGHLGIQWAWNLISPRWSGIWPGSSRPNPYRQANLIKAVVLMTDGEFNTAYTGSPGKAAMTMESYDHTDELCRNIKDEGVIIFAVAFDLRERDAREALSRCATNEDYFFRAENEEELRRAYRDIAIKLTKLRIVK
jgi:Flp pilus assembly protein TadG